MGSQFRDRLFSELIHFADSQRAAMHDRVSLSYRFRVHKDRWYVIEQRGYADVVNGKITNLNLVCSGFRPA